MGLALPVQVQRTTQPQQATVIQPLCFFRFCTRVLSNVLVFERLGVSPKLDVLSTQMQVCIMRYVHVHCERSVHWSYVQLAFVCGGFSCDDQSSSSMFHPFLHHTK